MPFGRPRASSCPSGEVVPSISFLPLMVGNCVLCALYPPPPHHPSDAGCDHGLYIRCGQ